MGKTISKVVEFGGLAVLAYVTAGTAIALSAGVSFGAAVSAAVAASGLGTAATLGLISAGLGGLFGAGAGQKPESSYTALKPSHWSPGDADRLIEADTRPLDRGARP
jgi:hypothetical protein